MAPEVLKIERSRWTLPLLQAVEPAWRCYSLSGLWRLLRALKIRYKRGRHYVHCPDPDYITKRDKAQTCVTATRQHPDQVATFYLDEFSFYRQPTLAQAWHPAGYSQPLARRAHRSNIYHRVLGALNATAGQVLFRMARKTDVPFICSFLRHLRSTQSKDKEVNVILDNWYRVHDHPAVLETAREEHINLDYSPTCAPWLNPIEKLWRKAYQEVLHLHRYSDRWSELIQRMNRFLSAYSKESNELLRYVGLLSV
jgi:transposase